MKNSTQNRCSRSILCASFFACGSFALPSALAQDDDEEIHELSPFVVSAADNQGYRATSTLAGTRLKTDLKDLGSAISIVTSEFLEDTGSTDAKNLLVYTTGTEVGGAYGNFGGSGAATGDLAENDRLRSDPGTASSSRVRGLSSASSTRNYFLSAFGFDSYNTDMVTISRGPNSILFGVGEPGGIVDTTLKRALMGREITDVSVGFGSEDSWRTTLDINREIVEGRIALRLNALYEEENFKQQPAYEEDTRYYLAAKAILFENENVDWLGQTVLNANYEIARREGTPVDPIPSQDRYRTWWEAPGSPEADAITGQTFRNWPNGGRDDYASQWVMDAAYGVETTPGSKANGQPHFWGAYVIAYDGNGAPGIGVSNANGEEFEVVDGTGGDFLLPDGVSRASGWFPFYSTESNQGPWGYYPGFQNHVIQNPNVFDFENKLLQGHLAHTNHDFDAYNVTLEQNFFNNKMGIELAYDHQELSSDRWFPLSNGRNSSIKIDTSVYITNGARNPNVGRPVISGQIEPQRFNNDTRTTKRATGFFVHDFTQSDGWTRWLGKHTATGLYTEWSNSRDSRDVGLSWSTDHDVGQDFTSIVGKPGGWGGRAFFLGYIGDAQYGAATPSDVRFYENPAQFELPKVGDFFNNYYFDKETKEIVESTVSLRDILVGASFQNQTIESEAITLQSAFLDNSLITTFGWRDDTSLASESDRIRNDEDLSTNLEATRANLRETEFSGQTRTSQVVYHVPSKFTENLPLSPEISFHWSESENFNPSSLRRDVFGNEIGPPAGETTEKGFSIGLMEDRLNLRFNWYETAQVRVRNGNIQNSLWGFDWPVSWAGRWLQSKNGWVNGTGVPFEDTGWGDPTDPNEVFDPTATGDYTSYDEVINTLLTEVMPEATARELYESWPPQVTGPLGEEKITPAKDLGSLRSVADSVSEGFEIEAVYNITPNWRMAFNASKTEALFTNGLKQITPLAETVTDNLKRLGLWDMYEGGYIHRTRMSTRYTNEALTPLAAAQAKENTLNAELRKWRWNMVTNYSFADGVLSGFGVGGAIRWQDEIATGYPLIQGENNILIPDLANPLFGPSDWRGDVWFSYKTRLFGDSVPVKFQLNMHNVLGDDDPLVVATNPDGQVAVIRTAPQQRWFFKTTFEF